MERKIGETFEYEGHKLRVVEGGIDKCDECFFYNIDCISNKYVRGFCAGDSRTDKKNVIFIEYNDEQPQEQAEQPQKLNLCEILRDCPNGTKLYSTVLGYVIFQGIVEGAVYPIVVSCENGVNEDFTADGKMFIDFDGECTLFPSKEQRRWADFIDPWLKKERFDPKTLKPFDRVLAMNSSTWHCATFSHLRNTKSEFVYDCGGIYFRYCIPYNDDTKYLVGTTDEAPKFYRYWED